MKIVLLIARLLLGLIFVVLGLNGFLNFLSMGPMPTGLAGQFIGALVLSHYYWVVAVLQIAGGLLLLANRFVPLALVLRSEEHTSELQSHSDLVCRLLLEKKKPSHYHLPNYYKSSIQTAPSLYS